MINSIIFDFGDVFINLDKQAPLQNLQKLGLVEWNSELDLLNQQFEKGLIEKVTFLIGIQNHIPGANLIDIEKAWNSILLDFPLYRLEFLQLLSQKYRLFLLSNTDKIHIAEFESKNGISFYRDFYQCFEKVYFSFEMGMRKPELEIYQAVINNHELVPKHTLFVDDKKENTDTAKTLGLQVWNLQVGKDDVIQLFENE